MNTKELVAYLEENFKAPDKSRQRQILGQLQIMVNDSGVKLCSGQELIVRESIEQLVIKYPSNNGRHFVEMLVLATYINSCRNEQE
jgi:hypothetical protein